MHLLVEAKKLAFEDRNRVAGDPGFRSVAARAVHLQGPRRGAPRGDRSERARRPDGRAGRRARRRHQLLRGGRRRRQRGVLHPQPVERVRLGRRRRRHRRDAQQPRRPRLQPRPQPSERDRAGAPHHAHPERVPDLPRRPAVARGRHAGRRPADAVEHAGDHRRRRSRHVAAGSGRGAALAQLPRNGSRPASGKPQVVKVDERVPEASREALAAPRAHRADDSGRGAAAARCS